MNGVRILLGALVLLLGRRLFWLAVGIMGFLFGFDWVTYSLGDWPAWATWLAAIGLGSLCALGAIFLQRVSFGIGGFLAGAYLLVWLMTRLGFQNGPAPGLFFVVGGLAGAVLAVVFVDWVLVALTSLAGAAAVVEGIGASPLVSGLLFVGLAAVGIAVQTATLRWQGGSASGPSRPR
ncbi:MAG: DUF4203 domain-containing protein [Proteobacteria bacterium]|nr:DUF4203 domain-containing protein [Pseudomonadota bacterium]